MSVIFMGLMEVETNTLELGLSLMSAKIISKSSVQFSISNNCDFYLIFSFWFVFAHVNVTSNICICIPGKVPGSDPPPCLLWHQEGVCHRQSWGKVFWHENPVFFITRDHAAEKVRVFAQIDADAVFFALSLSHVIQSKMSPGKNILLSQIVSWQIGLPCKNVGN